MRLSGILDKVSELPMLPLILTRNDRRKYIRVLGTLVYVIWFFPAAILWLLVVTVLAIPAMIQDA